MKAATTIKLFAVLMTSVLIGCGSGEAVTPPVIVLNPTPDTESTENTDDTTDTTDTTDATDTTDTGNTSTNSENTANINRAGLVINGLAGRSPESVYPSWMVDLRTNRHESRTPGHGIAWASLREINNFNMLTAIDRFEPNGPKVGECKVFLNNNESTSALPFPLVDGGPSLQINSSTGVWAEIESNGDFDPRYQTSQPFPGAIPSGATLTIPGSSRFPAVAAYPVYEPEAPERLSPLATEWINSGSVFSWLPANNPDETIALDFNGYNSDGSYRELVAICSSVDDGNFELPSEIVQLFDAYDSFLDVQYFRVATRLDLVDDILFHQRNVVAE